MRYSLHVAVNICINCSFLHLYTQQVELSIVFKSANDTELPKPTAFMPVTVPRRASKNNEVAVCVKATFGEIENNRLVEWFELQRLLGVSHIGVYATPAIHLDTLLTLTKYAATPLVELRTVKYADGGSGNGHQQLVGSVAIQDCLYRHVYTHKFVGVYDFDEVRISALTRQSCQKQRSTGLGLAFPNYESGNSSSEAQGSWGIK